MQDLRRLYSKKLVALVCLIIALFFLWTQSSNPQLEYGYWVPQHLKRIIVPDLVEDFLDKVDLNVTASYLNYNGTMFHEPSNSSKVCDLKPPNLVGPIRVWLDAPALNTIATLYPWLEDGGHGYPECQARNKVAVIVPYRDRDHQLRTFLHNIHAFLKKQQLDYGIFIVEQVANQTFNRAKLMNVGYVIANKLYDWQCYVFHDVDLLPEDDRNIYSCPEQPRHMSVAVDKFGYKLPYGSLFGGVSAMTKAQFSKMNGFSNDYWGWGGEDDDISARCRYAIMGKTKTRWQKDGLRNLKFKLVDIELTKTHTRLLVDLMEQDLRPLLGAEIKKCRWKSPFRL